MNKPYKIYISLPSTYCIQVDDGDPEQAEELYQRIMTTWMLYMVETKFLERNLLQQQVLVDTFLQSFDEDFVGDDLE